MSEENRTFNALWVDSFAYTANEADLSVCLMCNEKTKKKSNVVRHFKNKHAAPLFKNIQMEMKEKKNLFGTDAEG